MAQRGRFEPLARENHRSSRPGCHSSSPLEDDQSNHREASPNSNGAANQYFTASLLQGSTQHLQISRPLN